MILGIIKTAQGFQILSTVGTFNAVISTVISAVAYRGKEGELYSPINHFISELGEVGVSRLAWVFNLSLIISGICLIGSNLSLGLILPGFLAKFGMVVGMLGSFDLAFVGVFPMNKREPHSYATMTFFRTGLLLMIVFNLAIVLQPEESLVLPRLYSLAGLPAVLLFSVFLMMIHEVVKDSAHPLITEDGERPRIWPLAIVEWSIFVAILIWFVIVISGF